MGRLDSIYRKRLDRLREELDSYIASHVQISGHKLSVPVMRSMPQEQKTGGIQQKFLNYVSVDENIEPRSSSYIPSGSVRIPEFLRTAGERPELEKRLAQKEESFSEMLLRMIDEKGLKDSDVYKRANIDRRLFSKIRADEAYVPSKKTAISFCLALQLEMDEAKKLLATAGYTLSASSRFDLIIMYLIETREYSVHFANIVLDDYGEGTLSR